MQAIFSDCGTIISSSEAPSRIKNAVTVHVKFANLADAEKARKTFDGQIADGRTLEVAILSAANSALLGSALASGIDLSKGGDLLADSGPSGTGMFVSFHASLWWHVGDN